MVTTGCDTPIDRCIDCTLLTTTDVPCLRCLHCRFVIGLPASLRGLGSALAFYTAKSGQQTPASPSCAQRIVVLNMRAPTRRQYSLCFLALPCIASGQQPRGSDRPENGVYMHNVDSHCGGFRSGPEVSTLQDIGAVRGDGFGGIRFAVAELLTTVRIVASADDRAHRLGEIWHGRSWPGIHTGVSG